MKYPYIIKKKRINLTIHKRMGDGTGGGKPVGLGGTRGVSWLFDFCRCFEVGVSDEETPVNTGLCKSKYVESISLTTIPPQTQTTGVKVNINLTITPEK